MKIVVNTFKTILVIFLLTVGFLYLWNPIFGSYLSPRLLAKVNTPTANRYLTQIEHEGGSTILGLSTPSLYERPSSVNSNLILMDSRIIAMRQFLIDRQSPMYPYAEVFVREADKVNLDWRLVASIAGVESAFGNLIPQGSFNAWGWKGDPTREWSHFSSWSAGIKVVTERLALGYGTDLTPFDMEATYCPPCGLNPEHAWANGVTRFMNELSAYEQNL